jgi:hypothetical protein
VYKHTLVKVKRQTQQAENPTPTVFITLEAARDGTNILLEYVTSEVAIDEPETRITDPNIVIDNNCTDDELHFAIPGNSKHMKLTATGVTRATPSKLPAGDHSPRLNSSSLTSKSVV